MPSVSCLTAGPLHFQGCLKGQLVDSEGRPASARPDPADQGAGADALNTVTENELVVHALLLQGATLQSSSHPAPS